jgi:hypothetical protein
MQTRFPERLMSSRQPAEVVTALPKCASDPYRGTPLGVEAAWCPDGIEVPPAVAVTENQGLA